MTTGIKLPKPRFLSTLSLRRATASPRPSGYGRGDFYPRSPCGERHGQFPFWSHPPVFLSTLSLRRATFFNTVQIVIIVVFLSTLSLRRATKNATRQVAQTCHFYPRSPCGERQCLPGFCRMTAEFLSTLSLRRATAGS